VENCWSWTVRVQILSRTRGLSGWAEAEEVDLWCRGEGGERELMRESAADWRDASRRRCEGTAGGMAMEIEPVVPWGLGSKSRWWFPG
jgi:hypothetical protein